MLLKGLLNNDDLVKALIYIDPDFLSKSIPSDFDRTSLLYDRIGLLGMCLIFKTKESPLYLAIGSIVLLAGMIPICLQALRFMYLFILIG